MKLFSVLLALVPIGIGVVTVVRRHTPLLPLALLLSGDDDLDVDDNQRWEANGWAAIVIGCVEIALGLWWLRIALHAQ